MMMLKPKISAALNNCGLHIFVPEIKAKIGSLAAGGMAYSLYKEQYETLKDTFAEFYGFDKKSFSFAKFSKLLNKYNAHESQIVLGPVLRAYMQSTAKIADQEQLMLLAIGLDKPHESVAQYIQSQTQISKDSARYDSLSPEEAAILIGKPLGINVAFSAYPGAEESALLEIDNPVASIVMHHTGGIEGAAAGGHWELTHNEDDIDRSAEESSKLKVVAGLFTDGSANLSQCGLSLLKAHVQLTNRNASASFFTRLDEKAHELSSALFNGTELKPAEVVQWCSEIQLSASKKAPKRERANESALASDELAFIKAAVKAQKNSSGGEKTVQYKEQLEHLFSHRTEIQEKAAQVAMKGGELSDEELALKLQAEEFDNAGFKR
jgi:hypothetical protein